MNFEDLKDPELQERLKSAKTPEDILALAKEKGLNLNDKQLKAISGGGDDEDAAKDFWTCTSPY